jgi:S-adenosylmethionine decarboxylase
MKSLGQQIVAEFYECDTDVLNNPQAVEQIMCDAAIAAGATIVSKTFHTFSPHGVSGAVIIAESHLAIHTWPEYGYAAVDLFTCGDTVVPEAAYRCLKAGLGSRRASTMEMKRGQLEVVGELTHKPMELKKAV